MTGPKVKARALPTCLAIYLVARTTHAWATPSADASEAAVLSKARTLQGQGQLDEALQLLKQAQAAEPNSEQVVLALASAYMKKRNPTWALRALARHLEEHEQSCLVRFALAWLYIQQAQKPQARQLLDQPGCTSPPEVVARRRIYTAYLDALDERRARASELIDDARSSPALFEEDQALLEHVAATTQPERVTWATGLVNVSNGWTSHGLAGSPVDQAARESAGTAITVLDARLRVMALNTGKIRPLVEGQFRAQQLWSSETSDLSFRTGTARAGLLLGSEAPRIVAAVAYDGTQTQGGDRYSDGPLWFSEARRAEVELELPGSVFIVSGVGQRNFREVGRTRGEIDGTIGWAAQQPRGLRFLGGLSARYHNAKNAAFDLAGLTAVSQVRVTLPKDFEAGTTLSVSLDNYYRSEGYFVSDAPSTRRDAQWRAVAALYTPPLIGLLRLATRYELSMRRSSATAYEYTDHRVLAALEWRIDSDQLGRDIIAARGRATADYGNLGGADGASGTQLRELMRQEENQRKNSTCSK